MRSETAGKIDKTASRGYVRRKMRGGENVQVIAGKARRLLLKTIPGTDTRPTQDRIKETLFNILQRDVPGCRFLDLFAGTGAIGIEALSRGAQRAVFVDNSRKAVACIRENLAHTYMETEATVMDTDALAAIRRLSLQGARFDIIFLDPPYDAGLEMPVLRALDASGILAVNGLVIVEARVGRTLEGLEETGFVITREKEYKNNKHIFLKRKEEA